MVLRDIRAKGVYVLTLQAWCDAPTGRLGVLSFRGWYAYAGSAQGPGGLKRVARHLAYRRRRRAPRRWHVDTLLARGVLGEAVVGLTERPVECRLVQSLAGRLAPAFPGFGSSDCRCPTHLFQAPSLDEAREAACRAMREAGVTPVILMCRDAAWPVDDGLKPES
ncbi:MAG: GIY-YIG nuclease family protein [Dehalococcoidia bacterium]